MTHGPNQHQSSLHRRALRNQAWLAWSTRLYGAALSTFLVARLFIRDHECGLVAFVNSVLHWLLKPALLLVIPALHRRGRVAGLLALPVGEFLRSYGRSFTRLTTDRTAQIVDGHPSFGLMTYNIHAEDTHLDRMAALIRQADPDIVCFQELSFPAARYFTRELASEYPYRALHPSGHASAGQGVLSRFPLGNSSYWQHPDIPNPLGHQRVEIDLHGTVVVLYNLHPVHPAMVGDGFNAEPRWREVERLLERIGCETQPVLFAGDFNLSDQSDDYRRLAKRYGDTFREVGRGMGYTFPDWRESHSRSVIKGLPLWFVPPMIRLDYVYHDAAFVPIEAQVWPHSGGADHRPLRVRLALKADFKVGMPGATDGY